MAELLNESVIARPSVTLRTAPAPIGVRRTSIAVLNIGVLATLAIASMLFAFAVPADDDFFRVTRQWEGNHDLGWIGFVFKTVYMHWQGRWASCGLESAVLPHADVTRRYWTIIAGVAVVDLLGIYAGCRWLTRGGPRRLAVGMTVVAAAAIWASIPSVAETVYWFTGAVENAMSLALAVLLLTAVASVPGRMPVGVKSIAIRTGIAIAAVVVVGFHELYGAMLCIVLAAGLAAAIFNRNGTAITWTVALAFAAAGLAVVVLAPGNAHRQAHDGTIHSRQFVYDAKLTAGFLYKYGRAWLTDPKLIAMSLWVAFSPSLEAARIPWATAKRFPWRIGIVAVWLAVVGVGFFGPTWGFGKEMPARTLSGNYVIFATGWLLVVYVWTRPIGGVIFPRVSATPAAAATLILGASLLLSGNTPGAAVEFFTRTRPWHAAMMKRYALLHRSPGQDVVVPRLPPPSPQLLMGDVKPAGDPKDYTNRNVSAVFGVKSVALAPE
jgi:hypothetical protein